MPDILAAFTRVISTGEDRWNAQCPAHEDRKNSLSIARGADARWLVKCHANCTLGAILAAAHLTMADLFSSNGHGPHTAGDVLATYDYRDAAGRLAYQVVKSWPKSFRPRRPDGQGGWILNLNGTTRLLYRLPELQRQKTVYIVEGEKDVDRLWSLGVAATTNAFGAGKWMPSYTEQLRVAGCRLVVVLPDNDPPGAAHGRDVARRCTDAGFDVKLVPLPDLPMKGDVSDYLERHTADDLRVLVEHAPLFNPAQRVAEPPELKLTSMADFLSEPDDTISSWVIAGIVPAAGVVLFVAPPKAGKSTNTRSMAVAVARGEPWLAWPTTQGRVWLLALEDKRSEVRRHLRRLGATASDPLLVFTGQAPPELFPQLERLTATQPPSLIIIDTLIRALNVRDLNDYAQVTAAFEPILRLARRSGAAIVAVHHASVHASREGLDAILGSTALAGSVDNVLVLRRSGDRRTLSSVQRIGQDLEPTIIAMDTETGRLSCAGSKRLVEERELRDQFVAALDTAGEPLTEAQLHDRVEGRKADKVRALRILLAQGLVERMGVGGRKDPFRYQVSGSCSRESGTRIPPATGREQELARKPPMNPGLFDAGSVRVPEVPYTNREQEQENRETNVRTSFEGPSSNHDPVLVPNGPRTVQTGPLESEKTHDKHVADSGSQISAIATDDGDERF